MLPKSKKRKQRAVVDTNVVVAGISGFRDQYIRGRVPSADLLHRWADEEHFVWLYSEDILAEYKVVLERLHVRSATIGLLINFVRERGEAVEIAPRPKYRRPQGRCLLYLCRGRKSRLHLHSQPERLPTEPPEGEGSRAGSHRKSSRPLRVEISKRSKAVHSFRIPPDRSVDSI